MQKNHYFFRVRNGYISTLSATFQEQEISVVYGVPNDSLGENNKKTWNKQPRLSKMIVSKSTHEWTRVNTSDHERPRVTTSENSLKYIFSVIMTSLIRHFIKLRLLNRKELISGDNKNRTWNISFTFPKGQGSDKVGPGGNSINPLVPPPFLAFPRHKIFFFFYFFFIFFYLFFICFT